MADLTEQVFAPLPAPARSFGDAFPITVGASPFTYAATAGVAVLVTGGTVSGIDYNRGAAALGTIGMIAGIVELDPGDSLTVTWAIAPTMTGIPR